MLGSEVQARVQEMCGDRAKAQLTDAIILRWISSGIKDVIMGLECSQRAFSCTVAAGGNTATPIDLVSNYWFVREKVVLYKGKALRRMTTQEITRFTNIYSYTDIPISVGTPECYFLQTTDTLDAVSIPQIYVYPGLELETSTDLAVIGIGIPSDAITASSEISYYIPLEYQELVVDYCMWHAKMLDEDWSAAKFLRDMYQESLAIARGEFRSSAGDFSIIREDPSEAYFQSGVDSW